MFRCARCGALVTICRSCDRGNIYCSNGCAEICRLESTRKAAKLYQASGKGARRHALRQKRYRWRLAGILPPVPGRFAGDNRGDTSPNPARDGGKALVIDLPPVNLGTVMPAEQGSTSHRHAIAWRDGVQAIAAPSPETPIVTHQGSPVPPEPLHMQPLELTVSDAHGEAGESRATAPPRAPVSVSHCHFCGRPTSGLVRYCFLSQEVP